MRWLNVAGLIFDLAGAIVVTIGVLASRAQIRRITGSYFGGPNPDAVADRQKQSLYALVGLSPLSLGFVLQIIGSWP